MSISCTAKLAQVAYRVGENNLSRLPDVTAVHDRLIAGLERGPAGQHLNASLEAGEEQFGNGRGESTAVTITW